MMADPKQNYDRKYTYNDRGRLIQVIGTLTTGEQCVEKYTYNSDGLVTEERPMP